MINKLDTISLTDFLLLLLYYILNKLCFFIYYQESLLCLKIYDPFSYSKKNPDGRHAQVLVQKNVVGHMTGIKTSFHLVLYICV